MSDAMGREEAERLVRLEEKLAHQEYTIGELDAVIRGQQQQLEVLAQGQRQLLDLLERLGRDKGELEGFDPDRERPPHY